MISKGATYTHKVEFSQANVNAFAEITGDKNPVHIDKEYAAKTVFGRPIVHGFLSASVFSKVFGTLFPGEGTIYLYQDMKFLAPVFVNAEYTAKFEVLEVFPEKHIATIKCILESAEGKPCIEGTAKLKNDVQF